MLDYTVFIFALKDLGLRSMILRKAKLVQNLPYLNMLLGKGENLLKGLSLLAIIVAKLVITNLATSSWNSVNISMIVLILGKTMMRVDLNRLDKLDKGHNTSPRVKKAWVRKIDTIHPLRGSGNGPRVRWSLGMSRIFVLVLSYILKHAELHALYFMVCIYFASILE
jgi:hypothetical protein